MLLVALSTNFSPFSISLAENKLKILIKGKNKPLLESRIEAKNRVLKILGAEYNL